MKTLLLVLLFNCTGPTGFYDCQGYEYAMATHEQCFKARMEAYRTFKTDVFTTCVDSRGEYYHLLGRTR